MGGIRSQETDQSTRQSPPPPEPKKREDGIDRDIAFPMPAAATPRLGFAPPTTAPASGEDKRKNHGEIFPIQQKRCSPEDTIKPGTQYIKWMLGNALE